MDFRTRHFLLCLCFAGDYIDEGMAKRTLHVFGLGVWAGGLGLHWTDKGQWGLTRQPCHCLLVGCLQASLRCGGRQVLIFLAVGAG
ncbi:hypothetical protein THAOC_14518 [Thalassiosira oceanica]|uniref:Uncharacterized protein n=1 Tax=Thalassiosira oceanica TaxID=159749 RepID=K0SIG3_THAOC|nr:hypothetical protein THAOC_14518 [Thalassiosira oceanica]|eukprot:EJK64719.1 hypothetical protein THAOC_14518 [Thalassiosira oceanica]